MWFRSRFGYDGLPFPRMIEVSTAFSCGSEVLVLGRVKVRLPQLAPSYRLPGILQGGQHS